MKKIIFLIFFLSFPFSVWSITWDVEYDCNTVPTSASPMWTHGGDGTTTSTAGLIYLVTSTTNYYYRSMTVDDDYGIVAEAKFKLNATASTTALYAAHLLQVATDEDMVTLGVFGNLLTLSVYPNKPIHQFYFDTTEWHTYRLCLLNNYVTLYVDGGYFYGLDISAYTDYNYHRVLFGDAISTGASSSSLYYDYIKYKIGTVGDPVTSDDYDDADRPDNYPTWVHELVKSEDNPIITSGAVDTWNEKVTYAFRPIMQLGSVSKTNAPYKSGSTYYAYVTGGYAADGYPGDQDQAGVATSTDKTTWTISTDPVMRFGTGEGPGISSGWNDGSWDDADVQVTSGFYDYDSNNFVGWYQGNSNPTLDDISMGYFFGTSITNLTKYTGNPVLQSSAGNDSVEMYHKIVIKDGSTYKAWYQAWTTIGVNDWQNTVYATSTDKTTWTKDTAVCGGQSWFSWIWQDNGITYAFAFDYNISNNITFYWSDDGGITWHYEGVVLEKGAAGTWEDDRIYWPSFFIEGSTAYFYYSGYDGSEAQIGMATASVPLDSVFYGPIITH